MFKFGAPKNSLRGNKIERKEIKTKQPLISWARLVSSYRKYLGNVKKTIPREKKPRKNTLNIALAYFFAKYASPIFHVTQDLKDI